MSQHPQGELAKWARKVSRLWWRSGTPRFSLERWGGKGTGMDREVTWAKAAKQVTNLGSTQF